MFGLQTRDAIWLWLGLSLLLGCESQGPPNIVLISIDTLRADHLGAYGYSRPTSPRIDRFAARSALFENAYSHSPKTAESHMSLMTGLIPEVHRIENWSLDRPSEADRSLSPEIPVLAEILQNAGYRTAAYTGGSNVHKLLGFGRGFEVYDQRRDDPQASFIEATAHMRRFVEEESESGRGAPFLLFVHSLAVHDPYLPPAKYQGLFANSRYSGRMIGDRDSLLAPTRDASNIHEAFWNRVDAASPADLQHLRDLYDECIRFTDDLVGDLIDALDALDIADETVVVLLSDHGEQFQEHGGFGHNALFDEILRVPLMLSVPGERGRRLAPVVRLVDVLPTLLELAGVESPLRIHGKSLSGLLAGVAEDKPRVVVSQWLDIGHFALRRGRWKFVDSQSRFGGSLYDLVDDPGEQRNLASERVNVRGDLQRRLKSTIEESRSFRERLVPGTAQTLDARGRAALEALGYLSGRN